MFIDHVISWIFSLFNHQYPLLHIFAVDAFELTTKEHASEDGKLPRIRLNGQESKAKLASREAEKNGIKEAELGPKEALYEWVDKFEDLVSGHGPATRSEENKASSALKYLLVEYSPTYTLNPMYEGVNICAEALLYALEEQQDWKVIGEMVVELRQALGTRPGHGLFRK